MLIDLIDLEFLNHSTIFLRSVRESDGPKATNDTKSDWVASTPPAVEKTEAAKDHFTKGKYSKVT